MSKGLDLEASKRSVARFPLGLTNVLLSTLDKLVAQISAHLLLLYPPIAATTEPLSCMAISRSLIANDPRLTVI